MIDRLLKFFGQTEELPREEGQRERIKHATAVLLVEIARADHERQASEDAEIQSQLATHFELSPTDAAALVEKAERAAEQSVSLHEFTRALHAEMDYAEKVSVIEMLWKIALADRDLDKYEDYMIAKIADLLYVARGDVLRLKARVIDSLSL